MRCEIQGLQPCNDLSFNNCTYPIRFALLRHWRRPIEPLMLNEYHELRYAYDEPSARTLLYFETLSLESGDKLLSDSLGIYASSIVKCEDVVRETREAIVGGSPVMLSIDRFHEPRVPDYYQRAHHLHNVLVFGFDDVLRCFRLFEDRIDGRGRELMACEVSYADTALAYQSCWEQWPAELATTPTFVAYRAGPAPTDLELVVERVRKRFVTSMVQRTSHATASRDALEQYLPVFRRELSRPATHAVLAAYHMMFQRVGELAATRHVQARVAIRALDTVLDSSADALLKAWRRVSVRMLKGLADTRLEHGRACIEDVAATLPAVLELERQYQIEQAAAFERAARAFGL